MGYTPRVVEEFDTNRLTVAERLAYAASSALVKECVASLHHPKAKWKRKKSNRGVEFHCPHTAITCPMGFYEKDSNLYYAKGWGAHESLLPQEKWLMWRIANRLYPPAVLEWSAADEEQERRLYEAGRSAFWLYPDRWKGITDPRTQCMKMEDHDVRALSMIHALAADRERAKSKPQRSTAFDTAISKRETNKPKVFTPPAVVSAADFANGGIDHVRKSR